MDDDFGGGFGDAMDDGGDFGGDFGGGFDEPQTAPAPQPSPKASPKAKITRSSKRSSQRRGGDLYAKSPQQRMAEKQAELEMQVSCAVNPVGFCACVLFDCAYAYANRQPGDQTKRGSN